MSAGSENFPPDGSHWSEREVNVGAFKDARLGNRFVELLRCLSDRMGGTIPLACQDWASTKAAYRFFSNPRVEEGDILSGHFDATRTRYSATGGTVLLLQDTTEFTYQRRNPHDVGFTKSVNSGRDSKGRLRHHAVCGILMHSSLAVTTEGLPLGLAAVKFWNRDKFKGTAQLKRKINPTRVPIETKESIRWLDNLRQSLALLGQPERCVHVGDRESDIYELYCLARELGTHFVVRTVVDRLAGNGGHTVKSEMAAAESAGTHVIELRGDDDAIERITLDIRYKRIHDGFISIERFQSLTNLDKVLSLSFWRDEAAVAAWRNLPAHRRVQAAGRNHVFADYHLRIAAVTRDYSMNSRKEAPSDSRAIHKAAPDHI